MRAEIDNDGDLLIFTESYDLCQNCKHINKCPLIQAIRQEIVILHYSDIAVGDCGLYAKRK